MYYLLRWLLMAVDGRVMGDLLETELLKTPNKANVITVLPAPFFRFSFRQKVD